MLRSINGLFIPYISWTIITITIFSFLNGTIFQWGDGVKFSLNNILNSLIYSRYTPLWFIKILFIMRLLSILLIKLKNKKILFLLIIMCEVVVALYINPSYYGLIRWLPIYMYGGYCATYYKDFSTKSIYKNNYKAFSIIICIIVIITFISSYLYNNERLICLYQYASGMMLIKIWGMRSNVKLNNIYNYSFWIYCTHNIIIKFLKPCFILVFGKSNFSAWIWTIGSIELIVLLSIFSGITFSKITPKIYKVLTGGR